MVFKYTLFFTIALFDVNGSIPKILTLRKCLISIVLKSKQAKIIFLDILVCIFVKMERIILIAFQLIVGFTLYKRIMTSKNLFS